MQYYKCNIRVEDIEQWALITCLMLIEIPFGFKFEHDIIILDSLIKLQYGIPPVSSIKD
jgi:hypothetical protein